MAQELKVQFQGHHDFVLPMDTIAPIEPQAAREWLDGEFMRLECEPIRASGKVLNADKVVRIAQAAGQKALPIAHGHTNLLPLHALR